MNGKLAADSIQIVTLSRISRLLSDAACVLFDRLLPVTTMGPSLCNWGGMRSRSDSRETLSEGKATHF